MTASVGATPRYATTPPLPKGAAKLNLEPARGRILLYEIDRISVIVALATAGFQFWAYWVAAPIWVFPALMFGLRWGHLVEHNHAHLPLFRSKALNEMIGWVMGLHGGIPLEIYREQHVRNHHSHLNQEADWSSPYNFDGCSYPDKPVNYWYYIGTYWLLSAMHVLSGFLRKPRSRKTRRFVVSIAVMGTVAAFMAWRDPVSFGLYFVAVWFANYIGVAVNNWDHHDGCAMEDVYTSAHNDLGGRARSGGFYIGFHTAHHWYGSLHWSMLPTFHRRYLAADMPDAYYTPVRPADSRVDVSPLPAP